MMRQTMEFGKETMKTIHYLKGDAIVPQAKE